MTIPTISSYPVALDDDTTLLGDPANQAVLTLSGDLSAGATVISVQENIDALTAPLFLVFATGEIVYAESKDDGLKRFYDVTRSSTPQGHNDGEAIYASIVSQHFSQPKRAILAIEQTLGLDPHGEASDVAARLELLFTSLTAVEDSVAALGTGLRWR